MQEGDGVGDKGSQHLGGSHVVGKNPGTVDRLATESLEKSIVLLNAESELGLENIGTDQVGHAESGAVHLVAIGRSDSTLSGSDLVLSLELLTALIKRAVIRHHKMGAVADQKILLIDLNTTGAESLDLPDQGNRIDHDTIANHTDLPLAEDAGGNQVEDIFLVTIDNGVARIVAPLTANHNIDPSGQDIDDLPFAFVSPLGAYKNCICHDIYTRKPEVNPAKWSKIDSSLKECKEKGGADRCRI